MAAKEEMPPQPASRGRKAAALGNGEGSPSPERGITAVVARVRPVRRGGATATAARVQAGRAGADWKKRQRQSQHTEKAEASCKPEPSPAPVREVQVPRTSCQPRCLKGTASLPQFSTTNETCKRKWEEYILTGCFQNRKQFFLIKLAFLLQNLGQMLHGIFDLGVLHK